MDGDETPEPAPEVEALRDRLARARADYDNLQKRVARESAMERDRAKARVLEGLLPLHELVLMAAHQAQAHPVPREAAGLVEGLVLLAREFQRFLEREGLQPTGAVGETFDRAAHEAVAEEPAEGAAAGSVTRVIQPGYKLGDKVLRFAKVAVAPK
ncbi:MAG: nucleotide exchange factor GrpE [Thermoplasmatota archaeon]|nr:nucleotide exchange factor GrpE [Halobacteriales archaeon]